MSDPTDEKDECQACAEALGPCERHRPEETEKWLRRRLIEIAKAAYNSGLADAGRSDWTGTTEYPRLLNDFVAAFMAQHAATLAHLAQTGADEVRALVDAYRDEVLHRRAGAIIHPPFPARTALLAAFAAKDAELAALRQQRDEARAIGYRDGLDDSSKGKDNVLAALAEAYEKLAYAEQEGVGALEAALAAQQQYYCDHNCGDEHTERCKAMTAALPSGRSHLSRRGQGPMTPTEPTAGRDT